MSTVERDTTSATTKFISLRDLKDVPNGGIQQQVIDSWITDFQEFSGKDTNDFKLTPLQQRVANDPETFGKRQSDQVIRGPNLVITGPTSAGKTLCAEMLIANHLARAAHPIGCIYAVPLRALATEKWERFQSIFGPTQVYVSSSDYQEYDPLILNRRFRIVVVVYEKLYSWLTHSETAGRILRKTALFLFDELQMLSDPQRGAKLELILTFLRDRQKRFSDSEDPRYHSFRILGLGPGGDALREAATWLKATRIEVFDEQRPVPLVEGYINLHGKRYHEPLSSELSTLYVDEVFPLPKVSGTTRDELTENFVVRTLTSSTGKSLTVGEGKRILVYSATKTGAEGMAQNLARALGKRQELDEKTQEAIANLEGTDTLQILKKTIVSGVGFHHGDLTLDERMLVEKLFKGHRGTSKLDVVVCTPTLAMGVNLPADYMLFSTAETFRQTEFQSSGIVTEPLTPLEYKQFAGRAGRYRPDPPLGHHGVALFLTDKDEEEAKREIVEGLMRRKADPIEPALHRWPYGLVPLALGVLAWEGSYFETDFSPVRIKDIFTDTLAGHSRVFTQYNRELYPIQDAAVKELQELSDPHPELVGGKPMEEFSLAGPGKVVAEQGIDIKTYEILQKLAHELPGILNHPFVLLEELVQAAEVVRLYPTSIPEGFKAALLTRKLRSFFQKQTENGYKLGPIASGLLRAKYVPSDAHLTYLIRIVAAWLWMQGEKTETITKSPLLPDMRHGAVATLTDQLSWFMGALEPLWAALEYQPAIEKVKEEDWESWIKQHQWDIKRFELRLRYGVHEGLESVARLRVRGWHRERLVDLWEQLGKWEHPVELLNCSPQDVELNLQKLFSELQKSVRRRKWSDDPRDVLDRQISLIFQAKHNYDEQYVDPHWNEIIRDLYFCKGLEFIQAVYDALVSKPLQMQATIEKQQAISSTNIALICGSRYVGIVTIGSEKGEIHWSQIASSADMIPDGKSLVSLICVCEVQIADNIEQKLKSSPIPILVLSREAFAQLCARAVDDPDAVDAGDVGDKEKRNRTPAVRRVKTLLENPNNAVFRTSKDIDKELNRDGSEPRIVGDVELIGGREIKTQKNDIARQPINLLRHALQGVDEKLEDFPRHEMVAEEIFTSISEARNLLPSEPVECVAFCKDILEALMRDIYQCKEQETVPDNWNKLIKRLIASEILPNWIVNLTDFEKYIGNQSFSVGTKIQVNDQMVSVQSSITAEEAVMILDNVVRISRWYLLDWSKKVEQSLQAILPAQLAIALSEAFDQDSLEQMLRLRLGKKLFNIVPQGRDFPTIMHKLTERADAEGWIPDLIVAAYAENPDNQEVQAFGQQFERLFIKWGIKVPTK